MYTSIGLRPFAEKELAFLKEYCTVLEPLSRGLDILQGEDRCYYGTLLPTLTTIVKKTKSEVPKLSSMTAGFAFAIESSIKRRFSHIFDAKDAIIAALTLPKFKVKWVDSQEKDSYKQMRMEELESDTDLSIEEQDSRRRKQIIMTLIPMMIIGQKKMVWRVKLQSTLRMQKVSSVWINIQKLDDCS